MSKDANVLAILEAAQNIGLNEGYVAQLKAQSRQYVQDNVRFPTESDYLYTENAFLLGALIYAGYSGE